MKNSFHIRHHLFFLEVFSLSSWAIHRSSDFLKWLPKNMKDGHHHTNTIRPINAKWAPEYLKDSWQRSSAICNGSRNKLYQREEVQSESKN
jgi:hypothetical protein